MHISLIVNYSSLEPWWAAFHRGRESCQPFCHLHIPPQLWSYLYLIADPCFPVPTGIGQMWSSLVQVAFGLHPQMKVLLSQGPKPASPSS